MGRAVDLGLRSTWRGRLLRQSTSGLSVAEFCRREGTSVATYGYWRRRFRERRLSIQWAAIEATRRDRCAGGEPAALGAVRRAWMLGGSFLPLSLAPPRANDWVVLTLMDGTVPKLSRMGPVE